MTFTETRPPCDNCGLNFVVRYAPSWRKDGSFFVSKLCVPCHEDALRNGGCLSGSSATATSLWDKS